MIVRKLKITGKISAWFVVLGAVGVVGLMVATLMIWVWANRDGGYPPAPITPESIAQADADMRPRGSFENALVAKDQIFAALPSVIGGIEPGIEFRPRAVGEVEDCGGSYGAAGGRESKYQSFDGTPKMTNGNWLEVNDRSIAAAAEVGIELVPVRVDNPVYLNQVALKTPQGGIKVTIFNTPRDFEYGEMTVIAVVIDCHLPADKLDPPVQPTK